MGLGNFSKGVWKPKISDAHLDSERIMGWQKFTPGPTCSQEGCGEKAARLQWFRGALGHSL